MTTNYSLGSFHRILESWFVATHWDSAGRVHLRPLPPKWADGHWLQMRSAPNSSLILDETSQAFINCMVRLLWRDWHWGQSFSKKKLARGCQVKLPACRPVRRGCFSAPVLFSTKYHTAFRLERVFQLGLWCFSASCFSTQWDLKILKCSRMDSAWKVPDKTDTKKGPFNYIILFNNKLYDWILHGFR